MEPKRIAGRTFVIERHENDIVHLHFEPAAEVDDEQMAAIVEAIQGVSDDRKLPLLVHMANLRSADRNARDRGARAEAASAVAIITRSAVGRTIGNFYTLLSKPIVPSKMFGTEEEAIRWLEGFRK